MSLDVEPVVSTTEPSKKSSRRIITWLAVLLACTSMLALWQTVRVGRLAGQTIETVDDMTITKTSQELFRQAALPANQRSVETLERVTATPQSDQTGAVFSTQLSGANLGGNTLYARVTITASTSTSGGSESFLEVLFTQPVTDPSTADGGSACAVRYNSQDLATDPVAVTPHLTLPPCTADQRSASGLNL